MMYIDVWDSERGVFIGVLVLILCLWENCCNVGVIGSDFLKI